MNATPAAPAAAAPAAEARPSRGRDAQPAKADGGRDFWETWADEKASRPAPAKAEAPKAEVKAKPDDKGTKAEAPKADAKASKSDAKKGAKAKADDKPAKADAKKGAKAKTDEKPAKADAKGKKAADTGGDPSEQVKLFVGLGKEHGVSAGDVRGILAGKLGGDASKIGSIMLRDTHAYVKVPGDVASQLIARVHGTKHAGQTVKVERAQA